MADDTPELSAGPLPVIENLNAPEFFSGVAPFYSIGPGHVTITLASYRFDNSQVPPRQVLLVTARLVMPIPAAQDLALGLYDYLVQNGFDPAQRMAGQRTQ